MTDGKPNSVHQNKEEDEVYCTECYPLKCTDKTKGVKNNGRR